MLPVTGKCCSAELLPELPPQRSKAMIQLMQIARTSRSTLTKRLVYEPHARRVNEKLGHQDGGFLFLVTNRLLYGHSSFKKEQVERECYGSGNEYD